MSNIDDEKLRAAREKLACHIEPPKKTAAPSCSSDASCVNKTADKIRLTEMTSAGG